MIVNFFGRDNKRILILIILAVLCVCAFILSLSQGSLKLSLSQVLHSIFFESTGPHYQIIYNIRLPRTLVAALVGMSLSLSGCILQGIMRNPLASPHLIGISAGAGLAGIFILIVMPSAFHLLTPAAFIGALVTTIIIYALAWQQGLKPTRLILAGVAVSSFMGAWITALMIFFPERVHSVLGFMVGGLSARSWKHFYIILPYSVTGFLLAIVFAKRLNILLLGDDIARSLGLNVEKNRLLFIALAALLAASAVSVAGLLGFVGLIVPHMTRFFIGSDYRFLLPACALTGSCLLMACDTVARVALDPVELPVGIIMSVLGAPFFLYLLRSNFNKG